MFSYNVTYWLSLNTDNSRLTYQSVKLYLFSTFYAGYCHLRFTCD